MPKAKIVLVGPVKVGKTTIANFLAEMSEGASAADKYKPTKGIRFVNYFLNIE